MTRIQDCLSAILLLVLSSYAVAYDLSDHQKKELTLFGMKAMGLQVDLSAVRKVLSNPDIEEMVATGLNLNNLLCAGITDVRPLKVQSTYEITCVLYRGGSAKKSYIVDALKGVAFEP